MRLQGRPCGDRVAGLDGRNDRSMLTRILRNPFS